MTSACCPVCFFSLPFPVFSPFLFPFKQKHTFFSRRFFFFVLEEGATVRSFPVCVHCPFIWPSPGTCHRPHPCPRCTAAKRSTCQHRPSVWCSACSGRSATQTATSTSTSRARCSRRSAALSTRSLRGTPSTATHTIPWPCSSLRTPPPRPLRHSRVCHLSLSLTHMNPASCPSCERTSPKHTAQQRRWTARRTRQGWSRRG